MHDMRAVLPAIHLITSERAKIADSDRKTERYLKDRVQEKERLANAEREHVGLAPLRMDEGLVRAARAHAAQMASRNNLSHQFSGEPGVPERIAALESPSSIAISASGELYVALRSGHRVVRIDRSGRVWLVAGNGTQGSTGDGGPATSATLNNPVSLAPIVANRTLYILDDSGRITAWR